MRFGVVILPEHRWAEARERWRRAEEYGFDHAWTYDHVGWRDLVDGPWFDAVATLTAAATATERIRLGTHVASANFRHPAVFARSITAIDDISGGRLLLGLGAGGQGFDADVLGRPPLTGRERQARFTEFVTLLDEILTGERTTVEGEWFTAVDARSTPGCVQQPRVPFIVAGNAPRSIALAATYGDGWVTTGGQADDLDAWWDAVARNAERFDEALEAAGRPAGEPQRHLSLDTGPGYSLTSAEAFAEFLGRAEDLRFTDVICHWPRPSGWYAGDEAVLEEVAARFVSGR